MLKNKVHFSFLLLILLLFYPICHSQEADLVLEWKFDGEGNIETALDSSGNGLHGTIDYGQRIPRHAGYALNWEESLGQGIHYDYEEDSILNIRDKISVEVRIKLDEYPPVLKEGKARQTSIIMAPAWSLVIIERDGGFKLRATVRLGKTEGNPESIGWYSTDFIPLDRWVRVGFTYDSDTSRLDFYIDGQKSGGRDFKSTNFYDWTLQPQLASAWSALRPRPEGPYTMIVRAQQNYNAGYTDYHPVKSSIDDIRIWQGIRTDWRDIWEPPTAPSKFEAVRANGDINLSWDASILGEDAELATYTIEYLNKNYEWTKLATSLSELNYIHQEAGLSSYEYRIYTVDSFGNMGPFAYAEIEGVGNIVGVVRDDKGNILQGCEISIPELGRKAYTDDQGRYELKYVPEMFFLRVYKEGFRTFEDTIEIETGEETTLDIELEIITDPPICVSVEAMVGRPGEIILSWTLSSGEIYGIDIPNKYKIYRSKSEEDLYLGEFIEEIDGLEAIPHTYIFKDVPAENGVVYFYGVQSINEGSLTNNSKPLSIEVPFLPPPEMSTPANGRTVLNNQVVFGWEGGALNYDNFVLEYSMCPEFEGVEPIRVDATEFSPQNIITQGIWYWRVKGRFDYGAESIFAQPLAFNVIATDNEDEITIPYLGVEPKNISISNSEKSIDITYALNIESEVVLRIYSLAGVLVYEHKAKEGPGIYTIPWRLKNNQGQIVSPGLYLIFLRAKDVENREFATNSRLIITH